jgi:hypothetical protein
MNNKEPAYCLQCKSFIEESPSHTVLKTGFVVVRRVSYHAAICIGERDNDGGSETARTGRQHDTEASEQIQGEVEAVQA